MRVAMPSMGSAAHAHHGMGRSLPRPWEGLCVVQAACHARARLHMPGRVKQALCHEQLVQQTSCHSRGRLGGTRHLHSLVDAECDGRAQRQVLYRQACIAA